MLESLLAPKILKVPQKHKNTASRKQSRKSVVPEPPQDGKKLILYTNYYMFREVGHPQFTCLLVSFWLPLGVTFRHFWQKASIRELKNRCSKKHRKLVQKGHASTTRLWLPTPKEILLKESIQEILFRRYQEGSVTPKCLKARWRIYIYIYIRRPLVGHQAEEHIVSMK